MSGADLKRAKRAVRRRVLATRDEMPVSEREDRSARIAERVMSLPEVERASTVMAFWAFGSEPDTAPLIAGGRANADRIASIAIQYADGVTTAVDLGLDRGWLLEVPAAERESALADGLVVRGLDSAGVAVATVTVPPLRDDDPLGTAHDADQPLVVTTISDGDDLTLVMGVEGQVHLAGPVRLQVRFPDGSRLAVPVAADGTFRLLLPADRQDDFGTDRGRLVALRDGTIVASMPISSVAAARAGSGDMGRAAPVRGGAAGRASR